VEIDLFFYRKVYLAGFRKNDKINIICAKGGGGVVTESKENCTGRRRSIYIFFAKNT